MKRLLVTTCLFLVTCTAACAEPSGRLLIVGGALQPTNADIFAVLRDAVADTGTLAIIPAASGSASATTARFTAVLKSYGLRDEQIVGVELAVRDDDSTAEIDEADWRRNAHSAEEVAKIAAADVIWFTGGDQRRLTETLLEDGAATPMLVAVRERLADGALIGGTSAGAAIMSDPMITGGDPLAALGLDPDAERLTIDTGLGFLPFGLVDQHFDARSRLGRLAIAIATLPEPQRIGFGIDENTGLLYRFADQHIEVLGDATVTIIDGRLASWENRNGRAQIDDLLISVLSPGDGLELAGGRFTVAPTRKPTVGNEYYDGALPSGGGIALPAATLSRRLGEALLDRRGEDQLSQYSFVAKSTGRGRGVVFRFRQSRDARGYWGYDEDGIARYSIIGVELDLHPINIAFEPLND